MGIKSKMVAGFTVIGLLLFLSGAIAVYETSSLGRSIQNVIDDNLKSIEVSKEMEAAVAQISRGVLWSVNGRPDLGESLISAGRASFLSSYKIAHGNLTVEGEEVFVKDIYKSYLSFNAFADSVLTLAAAEGGGAWYFNSFLPSQDKLTVSIERLITVNQNAIYQSATQLKTGAFSAILPGLIAIFVGIVFVVLFNYFVNSFFITPIVKISQGVENYVKHAIPFRVKVDSKDEIERLKSSVEKLIMQNKSNKIDD